MPELETVQEPPFGWVSIKHYHPINIPEPPERITELDMETGGIFYDGPRCAACGEECGVETVDIGVGAYEYWGAVGYDSQLVDVSNCCEAEVREW